MLWEFFRYTVGECIEKMRFLCYNKRNDKSEFVKVNEIEAMFGESACIDSLDELDGSREITVSTFRENDEKGIAPRALYRKFGFQEGELTEEFGYPNQVFVLRP